MVDMLLPEQDPARPRRERQRHATIATNVRRREKQPTELLRLAQEQGYLTYSDISEALSEHSISTAAAP